MIMVTNSEKAGNALQKPNIYQNLSHGHSRQM